MKVYMKTFWMHVLSCRRVILYIAVAFLLTASVIFFGVSHIRSFYSSPIRVEMDCSLKNITMEKILQIEEQEKEGDLGLLQLTAWRYGAEEPAYEPVSGKKEHTGILYVCGSMALVLYAPVKSGSYESVMAKKDCVMTSSLSFALFGSTDTAGCWILVKGKKYQIAAVIESEDKILMLPADEGRVEKAVFVFRERDRIKDKLEVLGF